MLETPLNPDIFRERLRDLYARHHGLVQRACRRYVQNPDDADDLAQEVFVKAARAWNAFAGSCQPATWLYRVALNHCADHVRRRRRQSELAQRYAMALTESSPVDTDMPPRLADLMDTLRSGLGSHDGHIAYLRLEVGLKRAQIARVMGLPGTAVSRRLNRIRKRAAMLWRGLPD